MLGQHASAQNQHQISIQGTEKYPAQRIKKTQALDCTIAVFLRWSGLRLALVALNEFLDRSAYHPIDAAVVIGAVRLRFCRDALQSLDELAFDANSCQVFRHA
jgi:hypothetical protein